MDWLELPHRAIFSISAPSPRHPLLGLAQLPSPCSLHRLCYLFQASTCCPQHLCCLSQALHLFQHGSELVALYQPGAVDAWKQHAAQSKVCAARSEAGSDDKHEVFSTSVKHDVEAGLMGDSTVREWMTGLGLRGVKS